MKKGIFGIVAAIVFTVSTAFATETEPVPQHITEAFNKEFKHEGDVSWRATKTFYKASFNIKDQKLDAFYNLDGKMIGLSRFISVEQLPLALIKDVAKKSESATVTELFELLTDRGTEYFITYASDEGQKVFKSLGDSWVRY